jgi:hypothetical protein
MRVPDAELARVASRLAADGRLCPICGQQPDGVELDRQCGGDRYCQRVIDGAHVLLFSTDSEADRKFFAEVLGQRHVDAGGGWLIFALPPAELAVHPSETSSGHELFFMCDDLETTMQELRIKGVEFVGDIVEEQWGRVTRFRLPGGGDIGMYEPRHPRATEASAESGNQ